MRLSEFTQKTMFLSEPRFLSVQFEYCKKSWKKLCGLNDKAIPLGFSSRYKCQFDLAAFETEKAS